MGSAEDATAYPPVSGWTERTPPSHPPEGPDAARSSAGGVPVPVGVPMLETPPAGTDGSPLQKPGKGPRQRPVRWYALVAGALALVSGIGVVAVRVWDRPQIKDGRVIASEVVAGLRAQPVASVRAGYFDPAGMALDGRFTVTADGDAVGTVEESFAGRADYVAGAGVVAVRGDAAWWARRSPTRVSRARDRWIRPDSDGIPVNVASTFSPGGLADLVRSVTDGGVPLSDDTSYLGRPVTGFEKNGWTVLLTRDAPHSLVWIGGSLARDGPLRRVAWQHSAEGIGPASATGPAFVSARGPGHHLLEPLPVPIPPYLSITPTTPEDDAAQKTRKARLAVLPSMPGDPRDNHLPPGEAATELPPGESTLAQKAPAFTATVDARTCTGTTCSWTVSVTNTGDAPGQASVIASASPGMPSRTVPLGTLEPGQTRTTPTMTFANPAPAVRGRTTSVTVNYVADIYSPQVNGPDPAVLSRLREKGLDPWSSTILQKLDPAELVVVLKALDVMSRSGGDTSKVMKAAENAVHMGALPELRALIDSGRLENPEVLKEKLYNLTFEFEPDPTSTPPAKDRIGYRREVQVAAETLRRDPRARINLDGIERVNGRDYTVDVLIKTAEQGRARMVAVQVKSVNSAKLRSNLQKALKQLNGRGGVDGATGIAEGAPPGSERIALIYLEPYAGVLHVADRPALDRRLASDRINLIQDWCVDGTAQADEVVMVNQTGTHRWTKHQLNTLLGVSCA